MAKEAGIRAKGTNPASMANSAHVPSERPRVTGSAAREIDLQDKQNLTDKDLVVAYQAGERDAYDAIYNRHRDRVRRICYRMLGNTADAEEAVQETFLRTYKALGRFNGQYQLGAWVSRIASNVCLDQLRLRGRTVKTQGVDDEVLELEATGKLPDLVVEQQIDVAESLKGIQPLHARALMLRAVAGLSHQEIAGELEMTPEQVKSLLHRARSSFRRVWDEASGWVLAPLGLRLPFSKKETPSGDGLNLLATSPVTTSMLERVATSAVIAALALPGVNAAVVADSPPPAAQSIARPDVPRCLSAVVHPARRAHTTSAQTAQAVSASSGDGAATASSPEEEDKPLVALGDLTVEPPVTPSDQGNDGEIDPATAGASATKDVQRKVHEVATKLKETLKTAPSLGE